MNLTIDNWMVAWNPADRPLLRSAGVEPLSHPRSAGTQPGAVKVGPWPDVTRWSDAYDSTTGCCELVRGQEFNLHQKVMMNVHRLSYARRWRRHRSACRAR
jgi:hypothetical protein